MIWANGHIRYGATVVKFKYERNIYGNSISPHFSLLINIQRTFRFRVITSKSLLFSNPSMERAKILLILAYEIQNYGRTESEYALSLHSMVQY